MANAYRDNNFITTKTAALNTDGKTIVNIAVNPTNHAVKVSDGITGSNHGPKDALRDDNNVPVMMGVSSSDFSTPTVVYGDVNGNLMIQTT